MAEAFGLAATIIGVAATAISVAETLVTFANSYGGAEAKIDEIVDGLFVTSSTLRRLGEIIKNHKQYEHDGRGDLARAISSCENTSKRVSLALGQAELEPSGVEQKTQWMTKRWQKFKWAIGGEQGIDDLLAALTRSKSNIELLINVLNYGILSNMVQSGSDLNPQLKDELNDLKRQSILMARMLGLIKGETNNKREPIARREPRMEGDEADQPMDPQVTGARQAGNSFRGVTANGLDPGAGDDVGNDPNRARGTVLVGGPNSTTKEAVPAQPRSSISSVSPNPRPSSHSPRRPPPRSPPRSPARSPARSPPKPVRYAYGAWTIRCKTSTTYHIEKTPAGQPELEKIAREHQSAGNLSSLVALSHGACKAINKFLDRRKSNEPSLVVMKPLKKRWNPFLWRRQERPTALLVFRMRDDGLDDGRSVASSDYYSTSPSSDSDHRSEPRRRKRFALEEGRFRTSRRGEVDHLVVQSMPADEAYTSPAPPEAEEVPSTPEPPLPSQGEAEDLMAQYLAGFTASAAEDGAQPPEDE